MPDVDPKTYSKDVDIQDAFDPPTTLRGPYTLEPTHFAGMAGRSLVMRSLFDSLKRAAATDATVLIEGETGTGKEASGEAIHTQSRRARGPFVVIDCAAIPSQLLETELFGCERGAYTGAVVARAGAFEVASGGTIFLDEIGELGPDLQPRILRVLERKQIKRVGSALYQPVDVRLVAATNRSLRAEVAAGKFRADLYYRLAVVQLRVPPLRERLADLPLIIETLLDRLDATDAPQATALRSPEFLAKLATYSWPGNVRQLRNYIERYLAMGGSSFPSPAESLLPASSSGSAPRLAMNGGALGSPGVPHFSDMPAISSKPAESKAPVIDPSLPFKEAKNQAVLDFERAYLDELLKAHDNITDAARAAGIERSYLYRMLSRHKIKPP